MTFDKMVKELVKARKMKQTAPPEEPTKDPLEQDLKKAKRQALLKRVMGGSK